MPDETKPVKTEAKPEPKHGRADGVKPDAPASATPEARHVGDPVEAASVAAIGHRLACGHQDSRIVPEHADEYALLLVKTVKTALAAYREKE